VAVNTVALFCEAKSPLSGVPTQLADDRARAADELSRAVH
jgi:hypothetical protein